MSKPKNADLWVVWTDSRFRVPNVKKYTGRLNKKGAMVVIRGFEKYLPPAHGRRFFVVQAQAEAFVRGYLEEKLVSLESQMEQIKKVLIDRDILAAVYAETVPDVQPPKKPIALK